MIVRDASAQLPACLASVAGWVDEIVIADTGSTDGTQALAHRLGARVIDIPWEDDFARARNLGLAQLRSDWALVLDADERLEACPGNCPGDSEAAAWRAQLTPAGEGPDAYQVNICNYVRSADARIWDKPAQPNHLYQLADSPWPEAAAAPAWIEHQNVRLFRRLPELYFVGRLHESVGPRVMACGLRLGHARGRIHHFGLALEPEAQAAKNHRYRRLQRQKVEDQPTDPQAHFELGVMEFDNYHDDAAALRCFERTLRLRPDFVAAWLYAGAALLRLGHPAEAAAFLAQAEARGQASPWLQEMQGDALYNGGRFLEAAARYRRAWRDAPASTTLLSKLGLAELRAGERDPGFNHLRQAVELAPQLDANHDRLVAALVHIEDWEAALRAQQARVRHFPDDPAAAARLAALNARQHSAKAGAPMRR